MTTTAAAPRSCARRMAPSQLAPAEWPIDPGAGMLWMKTALPATSRPWKSAVEPVPTHTASRSSVPSVGFERSAGTSESNR